MATYIGPITWTLNVARNNNREYKIVHKVKVAQDEGPTQVKQVSGLPAVGSTWNFFNSVDILAYCMPDMNIRPVITDGEFPEYYTVEQTFTTEIPDTKKCNDTQPTNPLLEPMEVSGGFQVYQEEATRDKDGKAIRNSAHEQIRGPMVEFDKNRPTVKIKQNVANLQLGLISLKMNTVNDRTLWGLPARCIKLSNISWSKKFYGQCSVYYERNLEFDINYRQVAVTEDDATTIVIKSGFDREVLDEGTKYLNGRWNATTGNFDLVNIAGVEPNPSNPMHFIKAVDRQGNPMRVILNGSGLPAEVTTSSGRQFIAIEDTLLNVATTDPRWLRIRSTTAGAFDAAASYDLGTLVSSNGITYVALNNGINNGQDPALDAANWLELPNGASDSGVWNSTTTYDAGAIVTDMEETSAGSIDIQYYTESNFLELGIPTTL